MKPAIKVFLKNYETKNRERLRRRSLHTGFLEERLKVEVDLEEQDKKTRVAVEIVELGIHEKWSPRRAMDNSAKEPPSDGGSIKKS